MKRKLPSQLACAHPETLVMRNMESVVPENSVFLRGSLYKKKNGKTRYAQKTVTNEINQHKRHLQVFFLKFKQQLFLRLHRKTMWMISLLKLHNELHHSFICYNFFHFGHRSSCACCLLIIDGPAYLGFI